MGSYRPVRYKLLGGLVSGVTVAGVIAAAGIVALEQMVDRLAEDHTHCKQLAYGLAEYPQIDVDAERVVTNMVVFSVRRAGEEPLTEEETEQFVTKAKEHGVLMGHIGEGRIRAVTHYGLDADDISEALVGIRRALIDLQL